MRIDDQWIRINPEEDSNGEKLRGQFARNIRTDGGMVIGRVIKGEEGKLTLQRYRHGEFVETGTYDTFNALHAAMLKDD
jgi:hypothetical protein